MTDSPSSILLLRLQSTGSNVNLWGGYLNVAMQMLEQAAKGYQTYALTVDVTISWSNYTLANTAACAVLKLTGTLTSALTMTLPGYMNDLKVINSAGQTVTIKCSGGTGVAIPNSRTAMLYCDGVDYYNSAPTWRGSTITPTNSGDLLTYSDVQTLIANATIPAAAGTVLNSAADTTAGYHAAKHTLSATGALSGSFSTSSPGGNESLLLTLAVGALGLTAASEQTAGFTAVAGNIYPVAIATSGTITFPASASNGDTVGVSNYGAGTVTFSWNGLKYNGSTTSMITTSKGIGIFRYTNSTTGWIDA